MKNNRVNHSLSTEELQGNELMKIIKYSLEIFTGNSLPQILRKYFRVYQINKQHEHHSVT
jgi:hypothetical protein